MRLTQLLALGLFIVDSEAKRLLELSNEESCTGDRCTGYRGKQNLTKSGKTCQKWTSQSPHAHSYSSEKYPNNGLGDHNYCRNVIDGSKSDTIWCYTTDSNKRWDWCEPIQSIDQDQNNQVSAQNDQGQELAQTNSPTSSNGTDQTENVEICSGIQCNGYRGKQNMTRTGKTCQKWTSQIPHAHTRTPKYFPTRGLGGDHNYCRNPDGSKTIWCYTTSTKADEDWDYCDPIGVVYSPSEYPDISVVKSGMQCEQGDNLGFFGDDFKCALASKNAGYQHFMFADSCNRRGCFGCKSLSTMTKESIWTVYKLTNKPEISKQNGVTSYTKAHSGMQCKMQGQNLGAFDTAKQCGVAAMDAGCDAFMHTDLYSSWGCRCCFSSSGYQEHYLWNVYSNTKNPKIYYNAITLTNPAFDVDYDHVAANAIDGKHTIAGTKWVGPTTPANWSADFGGYKQVTQVKVTDAWETLLNAKVYVIDSDNGDSESLCGTVSTTPPTDGTTYTVTCPSDTKGTKIRISKTTASADKIYFMGIREVEVYGN